MSKACNAVIRVCFGEYIVLLNNDTQVYPSWLKVMKQALNGGGIDLVMAYPMYSLTEPFARFREAQVLAGRWEDKAIQESFDYNFKDFSCVMFKKELVEEIGIEGKGLFDEIFFNYASDSDLFKRMDKAGKKYAACRAVPIHHIIDATGNVIPETPDIMNKDKKVFEDKWNPQAVPPLSTAAPVETVDKKDIPLVRTKETGDKIYFIKDNTIHWVRNPQVLEALGGTFGVEKTIEKSEFVKYEYGEPIGMNNIDKYK